jgi:hypothetical protein
VGFLPLGVLSAAGAGPVGPLPFPTDITGLIARYDSQNLSSIALSGSDVTQWDDLSGNGNHATQGTATNRPKSGTRTLNGKNVLDFDGSNDFLINNGVAASFTGEDKPWTFFFVTDRDATLNSGFSISSSTTNSPFIWQYASTMDLRDNGLNEVILFTTGSESSGLKIITYRSSGLNFTSWLAKTAVNTGTAYNIGGITINISTIGALRGTGGITNGTLFYNGAIGELIYYNRELTTSEVSRVQDYLVSRW